MRLHDQGASNIIWANKINLFIWITIWRDNSYQEICSFIFRKESLKLFRSWLQSPTRTNRWSISCSMWMWLIAVDLHVWTRTSSLPCQDLWCMVISIPMDCPSNPCRNRIISPTSTWSVPIYLSPCGMSTKWQTYPKHWPSAIMLTWDLFNDFQFIIA